MHLERVTFERRLELLVAVVGEAHRAAVERGSSTLMTLAPNSASIFPANGPRDQLPKFQNADSRKGS